MGFLASLFRVDQLGLCLRAHREKHQILQVRLAAPIKVHVDQELKDFTTFDSSYKVYSILTLLRAKKNLAALILLLTCCYQHYNTRYAKAIDNVQPKQLLCCSATHATFERCCIQGGFKFPTYFFNYPVLLGAVGYISNDSANFSI